MRTKAPRSSCQLPENDPNPRGGQDCTSGYAAEQPDTEEREDGTIRYRRNCGEGGLYAWREMARREATIKTTCDWVLEFGEGDANYKWAPFFSVGMPAGSGHPGRLSKQIRSKAA